MRAEVRKKRKKASRFKGKMKPDVICKRLRVQYYRSQSNIITSSVIISKIKIKKSSLKENL